MRSARRPGLLIPAFIEVLLLALPFGLAYWVHTDANRRGNDNAAMWAIVVGTLTFLTFFGGILALVVSIRDRD